MFTKPTSYEKEDLLKAAQGLLFGPSGPQLPLPNMLMMDRINLLSRNDGNFGKGYVEAVLHIHPKLWFFDCHFLGDPVMPGCLGLDALWQLLGFYLGWLGGEGKGRALGVKDVAFFGQVTPKTSTVTYRLHIKRIINRKLIMGVADGEIATPEATIYSAHDLKVGLFQDTTSF